MGVWIWGHRKNVEQSSVTKEQILLVRLSQALCQWELLSYFQHSYQCGATQRTHANNQQDRRKSVASGLRHSACTAVILDDTKTKNPALGFR